jgi:uncharacterized membrane protein
MNKWWALLLLCMTFLSVTHPVYAQSASTSADTSTSTQAAQSSSTVPALNQSLSSDGGNATATNQRQSGTYESARVLSIHSTTSGDSANQTQEQVFEVLIRSGALKGKTVSIKSDVDSNPYQIQPRQGDKIVVFIQEAENGDLAIYLQGFDRRIPMLWLFIAFVLTLALLSGWQGIKVVLSILISLGLIGWVLIPAFIRGINPIPIAIALSGIFTVLSSGLSFGWNKKTLATTLGTLGGAIVALLISVFFASWSHMNGLSSEEDRLFFSQNPTLNAEGLLFAGIIIAAMGVVEDVAVSIASGIEQVAQANPFISFKGLFTAGMIVGKDHMAAMANTIIFAYVGASLSTLLLYSQYDSNWLKFLNFDSVTEEIIRSLAATIGLVFTVPITAFLATWFIHSVGTARQQKKKTLLHTR